MPKAKKKKVVASEVGPSATAAPAPPKSSGKVKSAIAKRPPKGTPAAACLQVQLDKALEASAAAYTDYMRWGDMLDPAVAEMDASEKEFHRLKGWLDLEASDLGEFEGQLHQQWRRGVEKVRELVELMPVHMRVCEEIMKEMRGARDAWKACEVKVQVAARAVAAARK